MRGTTKSCGCYHKDRTIEHHRKVNKYDLTGDFGVGYCSNSDSKFLFDLEDYETIKEYCWHESKGYVQTNLPGDKEIYIHRLIMKDHITNSNQVIDHIDRDPMNNRKDNLRVATQRDNARNRSAGKNNVFGVVGIRWVDRVKKWRALIMVDRKNINLGYYSSFDDAVRARLRGELRYYGEFAPQKHLCKEYEVELEVQND